MAAVLAHEIAHIRNGDMARGMQLCIMVSGFSAVLQAGYMCLDSSLRTGSDSKGKLFPLAVAMMSSGALLFTMGRMLQMWHSRCREFAADEAAVAFTGSDALSQALAKIDASVRPDRECPLVKQELNFAHLHIADASPAETLSSTMSQVFQRCPSLQTMCNGLGDIKQRVFASHPQTEERCAAIMQAHHSLQNI